MFRFTQFILCKVCYTQNFRGGLIMNDNKEFKELPEGWKWVRLGEVCKNLKAGGTPARDMLDYWGGNIPFALVEDLTKNKYLTSTSETITEKGLKNSSVWIVPKKSILISIYASLGEVAINKIDTSTNQAILGMILKENYDLEFIYYLLKFNKNNFEKFTTQTTQKNLNKKIVSELKFALPTSIAEQQKIAEILETVDNAIEKTDRIIEKYKRIKQGLMQDLLTKGIDENGNIRSEKTHKFKDSPLGRIPEEWEVVRLEEVVEIHDNKRIPLSEEERVNRKGIYPYCGANGIIDHIDNYIFEGDYILLAEDGGFFSRFENSAYLMNGKFWVNNHAHVLKAREGISVNEFILAWLVFDDISKYISGTTRQKLNQFLMKNILLPLPPLPEQQRIAEILSQIDQTIEKEEQYKEKLERLKQGLMEDLLTGKVRVNHLIKED